VILRAASYAAFLGKMAAELQVVDKTPNGLQGRLSRRKPLAVPRPKKLEGPRAYAPRI
jgi:hypothetical protein